MRRATLCLAYALGTAQIAHAQASTDDLDKVFSSFSDTTPGCLVGVERNGGRPVVRAYGSADLEHGIKITPETVFEAGSVSKQFTSALVLLLVQDGTLKLSDDIRKYLPEMPDYGDVITVDHLLTHSSGLRDWGAIEYFAGWPRGDRIYTQSDVLQIAARQKALNFKPGTAWSYSNTGYNLLAIIVERVSGTSFAAVSKARLFAPLGMTKSQWRDDFRRIVPNRATAYEPSPAGFKAAMPFENTVGNGGLLTTVGDLLIWNRSLSSGALGKTIAATMARRAILNDGRAVDYGRGLFVGPWGETSRIYHSGSTGGYRAWLGRVPDKAVSIAMLCNAGGNSDSLGSAVLAAVVPGNAVAPPVDLDANPDLAKRAGSYVDQRYGLPMHLAQKDHHLVDDLGHAVARREGGGLELNGRALTFGPDGSIETDDTGSPVVLRRAQDYQPTARDLTRIIGRYTSPEANAQYRIERRGDELWIGVSDRPGWANRMKPVYTDTFLFDYGLIHLLRGPTGDVTALRPSNSRLWALVAPRAN